MQTKFLNAKELRLKRCHGALALVTPAKKTPLAPPRRALPLSNPDEYIVLSDSDGTEIGWLRSIAELDEDSRLALQKTLSELYVVTRIARVREVEKEPLSGHIRWRVEIEREEAAEQIGDGPDLDLAGGLDPAAGDASANGDALANGDSAPGMGARLLKKLSRDRDEDEQSSDERVFFIAGTEDVQTARYPQIFIVDTERNRYEILDCEALDIESRRAAERYF